MTDLLEVVDADGRKIKLRVMDPADMLDLSEAAGELSTNAGWMQRAMVAASLVEIDGVPVPMPSTKEEVRALSRKIGNVGFVAAARVLFGETGGRRGKARAADAVKN